MQARDRAEAYAEMQKLWAEADANGDGGLNEAEWLKAGFKVITSPWTPNPTGVTSAAMKPIAMAHHGRIGSASLIRNDIIIYERVGGAKRRRPQLSDAAAAAPLGARGALPTPQWESPVPSEGF